MMRLFGKAREMFMRLMLSFFLLLAFSPASAFSADQTGSKRFDIPIKWEFRLRSEIRNDFDLNASRSDDNRPLLQRFRFSVAPRWRSLQGFAQVQDSTVWNKERSPYASANLHLYQLYIDAPLKEGFRFRGGRQELSVGQERLVGAFGWSNNGRSFDGISVYRESGGRRLQFFAANLAAPRQRGFARGQNIFGLSWKVSDNKQSLEPYAFWLHDQTILRGEVQSGRTRLFTSGARFTRQDKAWKHNLEAAWQIGHRNEDSHLASAFTYRADHTWDIRHSPSAGGEYNYASGDGNPADGKSREFHNLYPTNHFQYGYIDMFGWRNMHNLRFIFSIKPSPRMQLELNYHEFWLATPRGAWKNAGGKVLARDLSGNSGRHVGSEFDAMSSYNFSSHWRFLLGISFFHPEGLARSTLGASTARFGYIQLLVTY